MATSVSDESRKCLASLRLICTAASNDCDSHPRLLYHEQLRDTLERFVLWSGNIGALHPACSSLSLETRLHEAQDVLIFILDLLKGLNEAIEELSEIVTSGCEDHAIPARVEKTLDDQYEVRELLEETSATITRLFNASTLIREVAPVDIFQKALSKNRYRFNNQFDVAYVGEKYPKLAGEPSIWLRKRLGEAITQRRHYLSYIQDHRTKLDCGSSEQKAEVTTSPQKLEHEVSVDKAITAEMLTDNASRSETFFTDVTAKVQPGLLLPRMLLENNQDDVDEDTKSYTTVTPSVEGDFESTAAVKIPKLEELRAGTTNEVECPFCFRIKKFRSEGQWRRHVFSDLRAYVCTFPGCNVAYFGDVNAWFRHEMQVHRVKYTCQLCDRISFERKDPYLAHIQKEHPVILVNTKEQSILDTACQSVLQIPARDCPCCYEWETDLKKIAVADHENSSASDDIVCVQPQAFKRHLASHLEHLALFAVPMLLGDAGDGDSNDAIEQTSVVHSDDVHQSQQNRGFGSIDIDGSVPHDLPPFIEVEILGSGSMGIVERVVNPIDLKEHARKIIRVSKRQKVMGLRRIMTEIRILRRLEHYHIISYFGSYVKESGPRSTLYCILYAVADLDLGEYLSRCEYDSTLLPRLRTFFGCLATALSYLHKSRVRHCDIKPSHVLIDRDNILVGGFTSSFDFSAGSYDAQGTTDEHFFHTRRYAAPEVFGKVGQVLDTDAKSDIWSLGLVFFEILVVLKGKPVEEMDLQGVDPRWKPSDIIDSLPKHLWELQLTGETTDNQPIEWIRRMLLVNPKLRPTASTLAAQITRAREEGTNSFCGTCCQIFDADFTD